MSTHQLEKIIRLKTIAENSKLYGKEKQKCVWPKIRDLRKKRGV